MLFTGSLNSITPYSRLLLIILVSSLLSSAISIAIARPVSSQIPESMPSSTSATGPAMIQIMSHQDGQQIQVGGLIIEGISSDNVDTDCQVYADVNDITPMQKATAIGSNGEADFSKWTFTYTSEYQLIKEGENELTAKISCFDVDGNSPAAGPTNEWHTVNVTGVLPANANIQSEDNEEGPNNSESFQECLSDIEGEERFPTNQEVQECISLNPPTDRTYDEDDANGDTEDASTDDPEDEETTE